MTFPESEPDRMYFEGKASSERIPEIPVTEWGPVVLASQPFSTPYTNDMLISMLPQEDREAGRDIVESAGIRTRFFRDLTGNPDPETILEEAVGHSATLVRRVLDRKGWDRLDALIDTSAILSPAFSEQLAGRLGLSPDSLFRRTIRTACSGVVTAFTDALANPALHGKRTVIVAAEPLSTVVNRNIFKLSHIGIPAIFGDDFAAIAFDPADFTVAALRSVVIPDGGVIRIRPFYQPPPHEPGTVPAHYILEPGAEEVFSSSQAGVFMRYIEPADGIMADMNGPATAKFFIRHTPPVIAWVLGEAARKGIVPENVIAHQPSRPVVDGINRALERSGFPQRISFLLDVMGRSNSSSATTPVSWQYQAQMDLIDPGKPTLIAAPGIGSIITAAVIVPNGYRG